jgi:hypothetical protein
MYIPRVIMSDDVSAKTDGRRDMVDSNSMQITPRPVACISRIHSPSRSGGERIGEGERAPDGMS